MVRLVVDVEVERGATRVEERDRTASPLPSSSLQTTGFSEGDLSRLWPICSLMAEGSTKKGGADDETAVEVALEAPPAKRQESKYCFILATTPESFTALKKGTDAMSAFSRPRIRRRRSACKLRFSAFSWCCIELLAAVTSKDAALRAW